jgi:hypothetical protein
MKKLVVILILALIIVGYFFFIKKDSSLDLENEYQIREVLKDNERVWSGVLPCIDCEGILVSLVLSDFNSENDNGEFTYSELYLGEEGGPYIKSGSWTRVGGEIVFDPKANEFDNFSYTALDNGGFLIPATLRISPGLPEEKYVLQEER